MSLIYLNDEDNIRWLMSIPKGVVCGKARVKVLIMSELSDSEA